VKKPEALARFRIAVQALYRLRARPSHSRSNALKQGLPALEACGLNVLVQNLLEQVMYGHFMLLAAFLMKTVASAWVPGNRNPVALAIGPR
jgi:hypothetical protein